MFETKVKPDTSAYKLGNTLINENSRTMNRLLGAGDKI